MFREAGFLGDEPQLDALGEDTFQVQPGPVVANFDDDISPLMKSAESDDAGAGLALGLAPLGGLDSVVHGIAKQMDQGIVDALDQMPIQLRLFSADLQFDQLAGLGGDVADQPAHFLEGRSNGHRAQRHGGVLEVFGDARQVDQVAGQLLVSHGAQPGVLAYQGLGYDQLAHQVEQIIELGRVHFDAAGRNHRLDSRGGPGGGDGEGCSGRGGVVRLPLLEGRNSTQQGARGHQERLFPGFSAQPALELRHKLLQGVARAKDELDKLPLRGEFALARQVQQCLQSMRQPVHGQEIQEARPTLEGVEGTKQGMQSACTGRVLLQGQGIQLNPLQVLPRLLGKLPQ